MFNRNQASSFALCLFAGLITGFNTSRNERENNIDLKSSTLLIMSLYAALRFNGNFDQRLNRVLGIALGIIIGLYAGRNITNVLSMSTNNLRHT